MQKREFSFNVFNLCLGSLRIVDRYNLVDSFLNYFTLLFTMNLV
jgi:hypothetical protein